MSVPSRKVLQRLGLTTENLLESFLGVNAKEELSYDELLVFWDGFGSTGSAAREQKVQLFARELFGALMDSLDEKKKLCTCPVAVGLDEGVVYWVGTELGLFQNLEHCVL